MAQSLIRSWSFIAFVVRGSPPISTTCAACQHKKTTASLILRRLDLDRSEDPKSFRVSTGTSGMRSRKHTASGLARCDTRAKDTHTRRQVNTKNAPPTGPLLGKTMKDNQGHDGQPVRARKSRMHNCGGVSSSIHKRNALKPSRINTANHSLHNFHAPGQTLNRLCEFMRCAGLTLV